MLAWVVIYRRHHRQARKPGATHLFHSGPINSLPSFLTSSHHYLLTSCFPYLLPSSVSRKSCVCHSYENCRVCTNNSHSGTHQSRVQFYPCPPFPTPYPLSSH